MEKTLGQIKVLSLDLLKISLFFYLVFLIIDIITNNFFIYFFNFQIILNIIIINIIFSLTLHFLEKKL